MENFLKHYRGTITALGPVFIGAGSVYKRNEYIFDERDNSVAIMDIGKVYQAFIDMGKDADIENYFSSFSPASLSLKDWFAVRQINKDSYCDWIKYSMAAGDSIIENSRGRRKFSDILAFIKDPYGLPYVPGSSIKGLLRTALSVYEISKKSTAQQDRLLDPVLSVLDEYDRLDERKQTDFRKKNSRNLYKKEALDIESEIFHTLKRKADKKSDAVNCNLSGLIIGDSAPVSLDSLTVCKKYDVRTDNSENALPIFKECLKPGTEISFDLTIDSSVCPYSLEQIIEAIKTLNSFVVKRFLRHFDAQYRLDADVAVGWLGSCGFTPKNIIHSFYDDQDEASATDVIDGIFDITLDKQYEIHKHGLDTSKYGVAPHMRKQTIYNSTRYDFGKVRFDFDK